MFRTPNLEEFHVTWYLQPTQFDSMGEEFLAERFIEDLMDGETCISLVIEEVQIPDMLTHRAGEDVGVGFRVLTTKDMATQLKELGYKVRHRDEPDEGTTWSEFIVLFNHLTRNQALLPQWDKPIRLTDDQDPHAPWFRVMGIKTDDDGPFVAIEEIQL